jgi:hypothetical protein
MGRKQNRCSKKERQTRRNEHSLEVLQKEVNSNVKTKNQPVSN